LDFDNFDQFIWSPFIFRIRSIGVNGFEVVVFSFNFFTGNCPTPFTVAPGGKKIKEVCEVVGG
jgi:hypothetical protein